MKKNLTKPFQAGIIDIGSHSVRLDIFEVTARGGNRLLESLNRPVNLGFDVFRRGAVSSQSINLLSSIMRDFVHKLDEYDAICRRAVATSAIREAFNRELVISRLSHESGIEFEILEAQAEAQITFQAMREELRAGRGFDSTSGIVFIIGTGSLIVIYFEQGLLKFCEAVPLGTVRVYDEFGNAGLKPDQIVAMLRTTAIEQRIKECSRIGDEPLTLIGIGAGIRLLAGADGEAHTFSSEEAEKLAERAIKADPAQLVEKFKIPDYAAMGVPPCGCLIDYFIKRFHCFEFLAPATTTRSALIADLVHRNSAPDADPFLADMISAAECVGEKYAFDRNHARRVQEYSLQIFDKLRRYYDLPPRSRVCLEIAALLHDIGRFVDARQHHKHSFYLISNSQLPGLTAAEQRVIATVARYHRKTPPKSSHPEYMALAADEKVTVLKLAAILRVADALDQAGRGRGRGIQLHLHGDELWIYSSGGGERELDQLYLGVKEDLFRDVFGLHLQLGESLEKL